jgi:membrane-bound lytic murein transglycosylase D
MKSTGQAYGLQIGALIDERMDPEKSSEAAAKYLHNLYQEFNDWTLVLAAYNSGGGKVRKAIRKAGSNSYWDVYEFLPRETRSYLPKFVAAAYLSNYYQHHGIDTQFAEADLLNTISAKIFEEIDFTTIAEESGTSLEIIEVLNPEYIKGFIPKSNGDYQLTLPSQSMSTFVTNNYSAQIVISSLPNSLKRKVASAKQVKRSVINELESDMVSDKWSFEIPVSESYTLYKLGKRETLTMVARKFNISISELLTTNNLKISNTNQLLPEHIKIPTTD